MKNDSIIFDLDGTLWDATPTSAVSWTEGLKSVGIHKTISVDDVKRVTGNPQNICIQMLLPQETQQFPHLINLLSRYEEAAIREKGGSLYKGVQEGIVSLANAFPLFIVSNCEGWYLDLFFRNSGLKKYFKDFDCFGSSNLAKSAMILQLLGKYDLKAAVYIGDTSTDEKAAHDAGIDFIHAKYGFGHTEKETVACSSFREIVARFI